MSTTGATLTYRRLRPEAPVGLLARACLELHPRSVQCARCTKACPVEALHLTSAGMGLDDGCLGCGRCMAACPTGALAVHGFSLKLTPESTLDALTLDCWMLPEHLSPPGAVRVPCLGGLNTSQLLALRYVGGSRRLILLDRGWCGECAAGRGDCHPAQAAVSTTRNWLGEIGAPASHWPTIEKRPLPVSSRRATIPDDVAAPTIIRHDVLSRLAREVATTASEVATFRIKDNGAGLAVRPVHSLAPLRAIEREHQLVLLEQLAARYGGSVPARFFPRVEIGPDCRDHRLCVNLCPTGALGVYDNRHEQGVTFDAAACLACGQCQRICPQHALRLQPLSERRSLHQKSVVLSRHAWRNCIECGEAFSANGRETHCPICRQSRDFARTGFDTLFHDNLHRTGRHKH